MRWTVFPAAGSEKLMHSHDDCLTDFCTRGWKSTFNVGAAGWLDFNFRSWAIWPYRLVDVCLPFILWGVFILFYYYFLWLSRGGGSFKAQPVCNKFLAIDSFLTLLSTSWLMCGLLNSDLFLQFWRHHCWFPRSKRGHFKVCWYSPCSSWCWYLCLRVFLLHAFHRLYYAWSTRAWHITSTFAGNS